jgi:ABC-type dipeptide/oligopeptide/nickel transport system permease component
MSTRLANLWRSSSRIDRAALFIVAVLTGCAFLIWPVVSSQFPEFAVVASWTRAEHVDPWGQAFVEDPSALTYSVGRNGIDEGGGGDDVVLFDAVGTRAPSGRVHAGALLLSQSFGFFLLLAVFIAGTYVSARRGPPVRTLGKELTRSLMLSVPVGVLAATMAFLASYTVITDHTRASVAQTMILPPTAALIGSVFVLTFVAILSVRLVHAQEAPYHEVARPLGPKTLEEAARAWLAEHPAAAASASSRAGPAAGKPQVTRGTRGS